MHKSQLGGFIIDCEASDPGEAAQFWSAALGMVQETRAGEEGEKYVGLLDNTNDLIIEVQAVPHPSRVHLDIETDDIDAEVYRLEALGARAIRRVKSWCVMQAPTGQRFCVVEAQNSGFGKNANVWNAAEDSQGS